jgi:hypothetical protein
MSVQGQTEKHSKRADISALPPITDIPGDRLAKLSSGGRECFHSISNTASALPAPEWADKITISCRLETGKFSTRSLSTTISRLRMNGRFAPEAALGGLEIQLPPYPRNRTQLGNRGMSEICQYRPKGLARSTYWREKIDSGGNAHSGSHARRSASIFREAGAR